MSCVVPVYNGERFLGEALDSIFGQTYRPIEVIVADDGSTDGTRTVVQHYRGEVRFVQQRTAGPAATRNLGVRSAIGGFLAFLDADDLWEPEKIERQMQCFDERPGLHACVTLARMFWVPELAGEAQQYREHPRNRAIPGYATTTLLARRSAFDVVGLFREDLWFADATEWFLRLREAGLALEVVEQVLVHHRMHPANLTRRRSAASKAEFARVVAASLARRRGAT